MNIQGWFPLGLTGLISLLSKGLWRVFCGTTVGNHQFFGAQPFFVVQVSYPYTTTRKNIALTLGTFVGKMMYLFFNTIWVYCSCFSKEQASFNFMATVTMCSDFGAQENKICHCFHCFLIYLPWCDGNLMPQSSFFQCGVSSQLFHSPLSLSSRGSSVPLCCLLFGWCHLHIWGYWYFSKQSCFIQPLISHDVLYI